MRRSLSYPAVAVAVLAGSSGCFLLAQAAAEGACQALDCGGSPGGTSSSSGSSSSSAGSSSSSGQASSAPLPSSSSASSSSSSSSGGGDAWEPNAGAPSHLVVVGDTLYWSSNSPTEGAIFRRALTEGGVMETVVSGEDRPFSLAVGAHAAFWVDGRDWTDNSGHGETVRTAPLEGGGAQTVAADGGFLGAVLAQGDTVYWTESISLWGKTPDAGAVEFAYPQASDNPGALAMTPGGVWAFGRYGSVVQAAVDPSTWSSSRPAFLVNSDGLSVSSVGQAAVGTGRVVLVFGGWLRCVQTANHSVTDWQDLDDGDTDGLGGVAIDEAHGRVYYTLRSDVMVGAGGGLRSVGINGDCTHQGPGQTLWTGERDQRTVAIHGGYVYWADHSRGAIRRLGLLP